MRALEGRRRPAAAGGRAVRAGAVYDVEHVTAFAYGSPVSGAVMALCMRPREDAGQRLLGFEIETDPPAAISAETDWFGNARHVATIHRRHAALRVVARSAVAPAPAPALPGSLAPGAWAEARRLSAREWDFSRPSAIARPSPALADFMRLRGLAEPAGDPLRAALGLSAALSDAFEFVPGATTAASPIEDVLGTGRGVCQDYAHVMIAISRSWGLPARYVSGYLYVVDGEGAPARARASHAWVECLVPGVGWVGLDPANRAVAGERHVRVAVGRDYRDVAPTRGVFRGGASQGLEVGVVVTPRPAP